MEWKPAARLSFIPFLWRGSVVSLCFRFSLTVINHLRLPQFPAGWRRQSEGATVGLLHSPQTPESNNNNEYLSVPLLTECKPLTFKMQVIRSKLPFSFSTHTQTWMQTHMHIHTNTVCMYTRIKIWLGYLAIVLQKVHTGASYGWGGGGIY